MPYRNSSLFLYVPLIFNIYIIYKTVRENKRGLGREGEKNAVRRTVRRISVGNWYIVIFSFIVIFAFPFV